MSMLAVTPLPGNADSYALCRLVTDQQLLHRVVALFPAHREHPFPPTETLSMLLAQSPSADRSCQQALNDAAVKRLVRSAG